MMAPTNQPRNTITIDAAGNKFTGLGFSNLSPWQKKRLREYYNRMQGGGGGILSNAPLLRQELIAAGFGGEPDFAKLGTRAEKLREYLGPTDYGSRLQESTDLAKLQAALALAQRGFAAMGAQPQRGESPIGTLGRTLASPLAGDLGKVASTLYQQRLAAKTAEEAEDRAVKLAAYTQAASRKKGLDAAVLKLLEKQEKGKSSLEKGVSFNYGGQNITGNVSVWRTPKGDKQIIRTVGEHTYTDPETNKKKLIPAGTYLTGFSKTPGKERIQKVPFEDPKWVLKKDAGGKWKHVGPNDTPVQVRQERGKEGELLHPLNTVTLKRRPLKEGEALFSTLPKDLKGTDTTGTSGVKITDAGLAQEIIKDPLDPTKTILGPLVETKITYKDGKFSQWRADTNTKITIGTNVGNYKMYQKPTGAPAKPTGLNTPEFKSVFSGMLAKLPDVRQRMELGKRGLKFDPAKYNINPDLKAGEDFPFSRQDGGEFLEKDQKTYLNKLKNAYFGLFKTTKTGADLVELDEAFIQSFLEADVKSLGLKDPPARADIPAAQITIPSAIQKRYVDLARELPTNPANEIIQKGPLPVGRKNLLSGFGKLVLFDKGVGVPFGPTTKSPASLSEGATPAEIEIRRKRIKSLNKLDIQRRLIAERISKGTTLASKLSPRLKFEQKIGVVSSALNAAEKKLNDALNEPKGKEIGETVGKSLETLAFIDGIDVKMKKSGLPGFVTGPIRAFGIRKLATDPGAWFQSDAGKEATREFLAKMPILEELVSRDLLKAAGEQRISDRDLKGIQGTLIKINQTGEINARQLRALRGYLKNSVKHSLEYVGSYGLPERVLEQAATLGIDVKSIEGRNGFYSPYLKDRKYAVTGKDVPSYSKAYQKQLRDSRIFGYSAIRPESGGTTQYELLKVDGNGNPIWDSSSKKYKTVLVPATKGWQTRVPGGAAVLNFNRKFLLKTYSLGR